VRSLLVALLLYGGVAGADEKCGDQLLAARGHLLASQRAMSPSRTAESKSRAAWAAVPPSCRTGMWYVTAANILRNPGSSEEPLVAGDVRFTTPAEALAAGLAVCPKDPELVAYIAYLSRIAPKLAPPLPAESCANVAAADPSLHAYVCGVQAFTAGQPAEAEKHLVAVKSPRFPDVAELLAAARKKTGHKSASPGPPTPALACDPFCPMESWRAAK